MEAFLADLQGSQLAELTRRSRWFYAAINGTHVLGIALLVGAITALNLRRLGAFATIEHRALSRVLTPVAAAGLALAIGTGLLMFASRADEYAALDVFRIKLILVGFGALTALALHLAYGMHMSRASPRRLAFHAALSEVTWLAALGAGRLIAFVG